MPRLVQSDALLAEACAALSRTPRIALDTEFHAERRYYPDLMLLQLRGGDGDAWLVDPCADIDVAPLAELLSTVPIVLHGGQMDVQILERALGVQLRVTFDTQIAAGCVGLGFPGRLQDLVRQVLGVRLPKGETLSDWSRRPLSPAQLGYAADDVMVLAPLAAALESRLVEQGSQEVFEHLLAEQLRWARAGDDDSRAWASIPGAAWLDDVELPFLVELARWRQVEARARDVPRHSLVSDGLLLDIARRAPEGMDALRANRRMPTNVWRREGDAILECVARARAHPVDPAVIGRPAPRPFSELVRAAGRGVEARTGVAPELLLPDRAVAALALGWDLESWRKNALGPAFMAFLQGDCSMEMPVRWRLAPES